MRIAFLLRSLNRGGAERQLTALCEGLHGVVVEGSDEHEMRAPADLTCSLDPGKAWHLHVEKADVRLPRLEQLDGLAAIACRTDDLELGPGER